MGWSGSNEIGFASRFRLRRGDPSRPWTGFGRVNFPGQTWIAAAGLGLGLGLPHGVACRRLTGAERQPADRTIRAHQRTTRRRWVCAAGARRGGRGSVSAGGGMARSGGCKLAVGKTGSEREWSGAERRERERSEPNGRAARRAGGEARRACMAGATALCGNPTCPKARAAPFRRPFP
jgi:hypothetical protein